MALDMRAFPAGEWPFRSGVSLESQLMASGAQSQETMATSVDGASTSIISTPLSDLERRLSTAKTLDLFTMKPRVSDSCV